MAGISSIESLFLSGSTNGRGIKVTGTSAATADTLHTATNTANTVDQVWLFAANQSSANLTLTLCLGGTTDPDDLVSLSLPPTSGDIPILQGERFAGGVVLKAYATTANYIVIRGIVDRITNG